MKWLAVAGILISAPLHADELASKVSAKLTNGVLTNQGTVGGSTTTVGGVALSYQKFLLPKFALGAGYRLDLDYSTGTVPLRGWDLLARYYVKGSGTRVTTVDEGVVSETTDNFSIYVGGDLSQRDYFLGGSPSADSSSTGSTSLTGSFLTTSAVAGADFRLGPRWQAILEGSYGLQTFAATDQRVSIHAALISVGMSFLW